MKNTVAVFPEKVLQELPVFYRFMTQMETVNVGELKVFSRFGESKRHYSKKYLKYPLNKTISEVEIIVANYGD